MRTAAAIGRTAVIGRRELVAGLGAAAAAAPALAAPQARAPARDLNGFWTNASGTPLERPRAFKSLTPSEAEVRAYEQGEAKVVHGIPGDDVGQDGAEWFAPEPPLMRIAGQARSSVIVDPADGRLPYRPEGRRALGGELAGMLKFDHPENRPVAERCLEGFSTPAGAPMLHTPQTNDAYQFVQTKDWLAIRTESNSDLRLVGLNPGAAPPQPIRPWLGVSVGRWEGATLVVETSRFEPRESLRSLPNMLYMSPEARVTERFTRVAPDQILYGFEVEDPATFTRPWRGELVFKTLSAPIYEYACHEGNYSLANVLAGARRNERDGR
ncbi:MAG: hypothetical protein ACJ798_11225 [Phenylobacterium sp.]